MLCTTLWISTLLLIQQLVFAHIKLRAHIDGTVNFIHTYRVF